MYMHFLIDFSTSNPQNSWKNVKKFDNIAFSDIQWLSRFQKNMDFYKIFLIQKQYKVYQI